MRKPGKQEGNESPMNHPFKLIDSIQKITLVYCVLPLDTGMGSKYSD